MLNAQCQTWSLVIGHWTLDIGYWLLGCLPPRMSEPGTDPGAQLERERVVAGAAPQPEQAGIHGPHGPALEHVRPDTGVQSLRGAAIGALRGNAGDQQPDCSIEPTPWRAEARLVAWREQDRDRPAVGRAARRDLERSVIDLQPRGSRFLRVAAKAYAHGRATGRQRPGKRDPRADDRAERARQQLGLAPRSEGDRDVATHLESLNEAVRRSEERRVGKECRSRWSPYH